MTPDELTKILRNNPDIVLIDDGAPTRPAPVAATLPAPTEHDEQVALFAWAALNSSAHPELSMLFAVPNGGLRHPAVAAMLRQEGVKAGVPDICLPVARGGANGGKVHHGLFIELKRAGKEGRATPEQQEWIRRLREYGYVAVICHGFVEAVSAITTYLSLE